jgi:hypothetical protein
MTVSLGGFDLSFELALCLLYARQARVIDEYCSIPTQIERRPLTSSYHVDGWLLYGMTKRQFVIYVRISIRQVGNDDFRRDNSLHYLTRDDAGLVDSIRSDCIVSTVLSNWLDDEFQDFVGSLTRRRTRFANGCDHKAGLVAHSRILAAASPRTAASSPRPRACAMMIASSARGMPT